MRLRNQLFGCRRYSKRDQGGDRSIQHRPTRGTLPSDGPNELPGPFYGIKTVSVRCCQCQSIVAFATSCLVFYKLARSFKTGASVAARSAFCAAVASTKRKFRPPHLQLISVQLTGEFRRTIVLQSVHVKQAMSSA